MKLSKRKLRNAKLAARECGTMDELRRQKWAREDDRQRAREDAPSVTIDKPTMRWTPEGRAELRRMREENGGNRMRFVLGPGSLARVVRDHSPLRKGEMVMLVSEPGPSAWDSGLTECEVLLGDALVHNVPMGALRPLDA
jgi:hypothetical protein